MPGDEVTKGDVPAFKRRELAHADKGRMPVAVDQSRGGGRGGPPQRIDHAGVFGPGARVGKDRPAQITTRPSDENIPSLPAIERSRPSKKAEIAQKRRTAGGLGTNFGLSQTETREHAQHGTGTADHLAPGDVGFDPVHRGLGFRRTAEAWVDRLEILPRQIGGAARSVINWRAVTLSRWIMYKPAPMMMAMPVRVSALGKSRNTR